MPLHLKAKAEKRRLSAVHRLLNERLYGDFFPLYPPLSRYLIN